MSPTVMPRKLDKRGARRCVSAISSAAGCNTVMTSMVMPISLSSCPGSAPGPDRVGTCYPLILGCIANSDALYSIPGCSHREDVQTHVSHSWLRFPARQIVVHLVRCPVALDDATGLVPDILVVAGRCPRDDDVFPGGGGIINAHGDAMIPLQVAVFQPIVAGDQGQHLAVVPVPVRCQMRMAIPANRRHYRDVRRSEIGRDLLWIHRGPSWQPRQG